jgi:hypothetical protein
VAVSAFGPGLVGVSEQDPDPPDRVPGALQLSPVPSLTVTVPVGVPLPGGLAVTVKLTVTACPTDDGLTEVLVIAVEVLSLMPVPARGTKLVAPPLLYLILSCASCWVVVTEGVKVTKMVQLPQAGMALWQSSVS